ILLDRHADVQARESLRGTTALMWAVEQRHPAAVKLLVSRGAEIGVASYPDTKGGTAYLAPTPQQRAVQDGIAPDGSLAGPRGGRRRAAETSDASLADRLAAADEAAANAAFGRTQSKDGGGLTPLVFAARENDLESAKILVEAGASVNQRTKYGW